MKRKIRLILYSLNSTAAISDELVEIELNQTTALLHVCEQLPKYYPQGFKPAKVRLIVDGVRRTAPDLGARANPTIESIVLKEMRSPSWQQPTKSSLFLVD